ncbi:hypothetical protein [Oceanirhabdus sp. W0125-5]|uniref:hypothetical protein n=1 Tax=Oceanirhabdus sp. W0125-5 TaxID=2999116 RepID=UPI0022F31C32|nr:hypothetical protein [Oceanirhabdus sp. W0125-5]WBW96332.1 hypothetical protein OW730_21950 [Oceanirhabdus sp. W0125-5]
MWWNILGVEIDSTLKEVKRAYAKLIKVAYQSEDQEEIIKIQSAYKKACDYIKSQSESEKKVFIPSDDGRKKTHAFVYEESNYKDTYYDYEEDEEEQEYHGEEENKELEENKISWDELEFTEDNERYKYKDIDQDLRHCKNIFDPIYTDMNKRFKREEWGQILDSLSFNEEEYFQENSYKYFNEYYQLSHEIWLLIDDSLDLSSKEEFIWKDKILNNDHLEYFKNENYSYEQLEEFFKLRNEAYEAFLNCDYDEVLKICDEVEKKEIDIDKPFFLKLKGLAYFETGYNQFSFNAFEKLQGYEGYEAEAKRYIAEIALINNDNKKALFLLKEIKDDDIKVLNEKKVIQALKGCKRKLKSFIKLRSYNIGINYDKSFNYRYATIIERLLLKNRLFIINGFYRSICWLRDVFILLSMVLIILLLVLGVLSIGVILIFGVIFAFPKFWGVLGVIYFIRKKKKKKKGQ